MPNSAAGKRKKCVTVVARVRPSGSRAHCWLSSIVVAGVRRFTGEHWISKDAARRPTTECLLGWLELEGVGVSRWAREYIEQKLRYIGDVEFQINR